MQNKFGGKQDSGKSDTYRLAAHILKLEAVSEELAKLPMTKLNTHQAL
ncbi:hypothetical protein Lalb_Chr12g0206761 [Lupinus albus]|uniref:Uncharacterized protein n=1 Tax=Lupinus albus TaxID=3870 RepID=A0A6A4PND2_LUPAL|nr:hypothetical protein Lalb_Chr12g0206761 [Lupinus albus]